MRPKVSVILVTYNREQLVCGAIASVLRQTYRDWELVVVDDGSTDNTQSAVMGCRLDDPRIWYFRNSQNFGIVASRSRALDEAAGEYIAVIDSDDLWSDEEKLAKQVAFLDEHPGHVMVGGGVIVTDGEGQEKHRYLNPESDEDIRRDILRRNPFAHSSVLYRASAARQVGGYGTLGAEDSSDSAEDYDLFLRLGQAGKMANLPEYLVNYREHGGNVTGEKRLAMMRKNLMLVKKHGSEYPGYWRAWLRRFVRLSAGRIYFRKR